MEEEKREVKAPPNKQLIMDIGKTKYTVNLYFKQGTGETYKDKILKLIKRETEKIQIYQRNFVYVLDKSFQIIQFEFLTSL